MSELAKRLGDDGDDSSSDDDGIPAFLKAGAVIHFEDERDSSPSSAAGGSHDSANGDANASSGGDAAIDEALVRSAVGAIELFLLTKDLDGLQDVIESPHFTRLEQQLPCVQALARLSRKILDGSHPKALNDDYLQPLKLGRLLAIFRVSANPIDEIREVCLDFILNKSRYPTEVGGVDRRRLISYVHSGIVLVLGIAYFELFLQMNFTGPELVAGDVNMLTDSGDLDSKGLSLLECDGEYPFPQVKLPLSLIISRVFLGLISDPTLMPWNKGVVLNGSGKVLRSKSTNIEAAKDCSRACEGFFSRAMWSARAVVVHGRCIQQNIYSKLPTLWAELLDLYPRAETAVSANISFDSKSSLDAMSFFGISSLPFSDVVSYMDIIYGVETSGIIIRDAHKKIVTQLYLEWGLSMHHFQYGDKGKGMFTTAQAKCGLYTELTGALGKRTKFQKIGYAQLYLIARSQLISPNDMNSNQASSSSASATYVDKYGIKRTSETVPDDSFVASATFTGRKEGYYFSKGIKGLGYYLDVKISINASTTNSEANSGVAAVDSSSANSSSSASSGGGATAPGVGKGEGEKGEGVNEEIPVFDVSIATSIAAAKAAATAKQEKEGGWIPAVYELGRRVVKDDGEGNEVAIREIRLDDVDGGAVENILFEEKVKWDVNVDKGGKLHPIDQAVLLAKCLDINNENPQDGLTSAEMFPYIERVLEIAENWMIHSTGLLERSWLEYEKRKTFDRALLQIQALLDQHTTKLTMFQSTYESIEQSAPVQDRVRYINCIVYPAQFELKRDLALRYMRGSVFVSALNLFKEVDMWDEVVQCYQFLDKPQRAEFVVRERLKTAETPYMLTALADLTNDVSYYERAWELSNRRYARAKRTLAQYFYNKKEYKTCIGHINEALLVQPLVASAWYLKGISCMQIEEWEDSVQAFVRCIQQDNEIGEALANIGAIRMRQRKFKEAYTVLYEAIKIKPDSWMIKENMMLVCMAISSYKEVIYFMDKLLDMRSKSKRPIHYDELRHMSKVIATMCVDPSFSMESPDASNSNSNSNNSDDNAAGGRRGGSGDGSKGINIDSDSIINDSCDDDNEWNPGVPVGSLLGSDVDESVLEALKQVNPDVDLANIPEPISVSQTTGLRLLPKIEALLKKITMSVKGDDMIWDIISDFYRILGSEKEVIECRLKQLRSAILDSHWEKTLDAIVKVKDIVKLTVEAHKSKLATSADLYGCLTLSQSICKRALVIFTLADEPVAELQAMVQELDALYKAARVAEGKA